MAVCLYDGAAYTIEDIEELERSQLLLFFLEGHREDVLVLYEKDGQYSGVITYKSVLESTDIADAVVHEKLFVEDDFWNTTKRLLSASGDILPVFNHKMEMLYLAKYEMKLSIAERMLHTVQNGVEREELKNFRCYKKYIHIKGLHSSVSWYLREWFLSLGVEVSVEGEMWRLFGIEEAACPPQKKDVEVIDDDGEFEWLGMLYEEYMAEDDMTKLGELLNKPYNSGTEETEKVMFYMSCFYYFLDSIRPLICRYIKSGKECVVVLPALDAIAERGRKSVREMTKLIEKLETAGAKCRSVKEPGLYGQQYAVCYLCSEYSDELPLEVKKIVQYVVSLQTTAIYTHMYYVKGRFENCFSEQARDGVDYLVASEYIANWICEREPAWEEKILRFGYPKLDNLYHAIKSEPDIPEEWKQKIDGKKVFLFTTYEMEQSWLDFFAGEKDKIAIWRPHPLAMENINWRKTAEKIGEKYNIIMDFQLSYYASFRISDAHIGQAITSVNVNYLYTGKPACSYDPGKDEELVIDFRQEAWYKSMYIASEEKDVLQFIKMVERGEDVLSEEQRQCRERVVKHFDGEVCNRIYDYIEGKKERLRESGS